MIALWLLVPLLAWIDYRNAHSRGWPTWHYVGCFLMINVAWVYFNQKAEPFFMWGPVGLFYLVVSYIVHRLLGNQYNSR